MTNHNNDGKKWQEGLADRFVPHFDEKYATIGPRHPLWTERVKQEILILSNYIKFLSQEFPIPWLQLKPDTNPKYRYTVWRGFIQVPKRPEIKFDMLILLSSEYPKVTPRCFLEESIIEYSGKIYVKNTYDDPLSKKRYVMICHDHMSEVGGVWAPTLGIAHFFIREVWFWFAAMQNHIIKEWDKKHPN